MVTLRMTVPHVPQQPPCFVCLNNLLVMPQQPPCYALTTSLLCHNNLLVMHQQPPCYFLITSLKFPKQPP